MTMGGNNMSLTLEQYLALSVFDYDNLKSGYKGQSIRIIS